MEERRRFGLLLFDSSQRMFRSAEVLRAYLQVLRRLSGAASISLYLPRGAGGSMRETLLHEGAAPPLPEIADAETARAFCRLSETETVADLADSGTKVYVSSETAGRVFRVRVGPSLASEPALAAASTAPRRRAIDSSEIASVTAPTTDGDLWIGLRLPVGVGEGDEARWRALLAFGGPLAWHARRASSLLVDPVTELPGRLGFQARVREAAEATSSARRASSLLLVNPDDFDVVNENFGHHGGDRVMSEMAERLRRALRRSDPVFRYGAAVFGVLLSLTPGPEATLVAEKLRRALGEEPYLDDRVRLSFSIGAATYEPRGVDTEVAAERGALEWVRRADRALGEAKAGGGRIVLAEPGGDTREIGHLDRLSGIFTANAAKDYRNMLLMWDTVTIIAGSEDFEALASRVSERLFNSFRPGRVALLGYDEGGELTMILQVGRRRGASPSTGEPDPGLAVLGEGEKKLLLQACSDRESVRENLAAAAGGSALEVCAVPMVSRDRCFGCLYLSSGGGSGEGIRLDASDVIFLEALAGQLATALDRARLAAREKEAREKEQRSLRAEVTALRHALQQAKLIYRSPQMEAVLTTARRVAPTDATVLITGESGTGKELLSRTLHELSARREAPLVIVDCGAIAASLIDSELFGHEKGAFTGAQRGAQGRLAEADGGTVVLDEIGELPLEVQSKLLRFVQERQLTPVGGIRPRSVDVRVVAVTNRDLAAEAAAGRFREDLFHRLNVIHLVIPPLRERPDDILFLADHFVERFALQYQKRVQGLTPQAAARLLGHRWPGNVRELQNRIMEAVILSDSDRIGPEELNLDTDGATFLQAAPVAPPTAPLPSAGGFHPRDSSASGREPARPARETARDPWSALRAALREQVKAASGGEAPRFVPLGTWLGEDLVLEAYATTREVSSRGARLLGVPKTTFRRRLEMAQARAEAGMSFRPDSWLPLRPLLARLLEGKDPRGEDLLRKTRGVLLEEVLKELPEKAARGAALMGVTIPTFRRWSSGVDPRDRSS